MIEQLVIDRLGHRGDGVADGGAEPIFVPGTLPGETAEVEGVRGRPDRRNLLRIDKPSVERIAPICPHFGVCGGCALQHWSIAPYRAWKRNLVVEALRMAGLDAPVSDLIDAYGEGRRRVVFHARYGAHNVLEVGFSAARAHHIVAIDRCPILAKKLDGALEAAWAIAEALAPAGKSLDIQVTATEAGLDVDVRGSGPLTPALTTTLAQVAALHGLARLTRHGELVAQQKAPTVQIGAASVLLPPAAFLQATTEGEATLSRLVLSSGASKGAVADLFAGIGPFALRLAEHAAILAVDDDEAAIGALKRAAATTSGLRPIETEHRDLFKHPLVVAELDRFEAVVFDPPRQGAHTQSCELAASSVPLIVAVSCNPATFARDMRHLVEGGYRLVEVTPVDQFRYSAHVEIVARLKR